jgi:8-oxo-dGTP pyrophosphatase MutT (NUDIX family)
MSLTQALGDLRRIVDRYCDVYHAQDQLSLLRTQITEGQNLWSRKNFRGHLTASVAVIFGEECLFVRHAALGKWLLPGGHLDAFEMPLIGALRELQEETALQDVFVADAASEMPFDIDTHWIPTNNEKTEPEHFHHDFRFVVYINTMPIVAIDPVESTEAAMFPLSALTVEYPRLASRIRIGRGAG